MARVAFHWTGFTVAGTASDSITEFPFYANTESTYITKSDAKVGFYFKIFWDSENKRNIFVMFDTDL